MTWLGPRVGSTFLGAGCALSLAFATACSKSDNNDSNDAGGEAGAESVSGGSSAGGSAANGGALHLGGEGGQGGDVSSLGGSRSGGGSSGGGGGSPSSGGADSCALEDHFASGVVSVDYGEGQDFGRDHFADWVLGGPRGGGAGSGATTHIISLGDGGSMVLSFPGQNFKNGPGPDLIVFENAFYVGGDPETPFFELGRVAVSADGEIWHEFPCDPDTFQGCAGVSPVLANVETNDVDPLDSAQAGGDAFDLEDLGLDEARYVRVSDILGDRDAISGVFDLDAVAVLYPSCDPK